MLNCGHVSSHNQRVLPRYTCSIVVTCLATTSACSPGTHARLWSRDQPQPARARQVRMFNYGHVSSHNQGVLARYACSIAVTCPATTSACSPGTHAQLWSRVWPQPARARQVRMLGCGHVTSHNQRVLLRYACSIVVTCPATTSTCSPGTHAQLWSRVRPQPARARQVHMFNCGHVSGHNQRVLVTYACSIVVTCLATTSACLSGTHAQLWSRVRPQPARARQVHMLNCGHGYSHNQRVLARYACSIVVMGTATTSACSPGTHAQLWSRVQPQPARARQVRMLNCSHVSGHNQRVLARYAFLAVVTCPATTSVCSPGTHAWLWSRDQTQPARARQVHMLGCGHVTGHNQRVLARYAAQL
jgi:hypothetical protein